MFGKARRAEKQAEQKAAGAARLRALVVEMIDLAEGGPGLQDDWPLVLKAGERMVGCLPDAGLFEPRRGAGHWDGRSAGVSVPVGDSGIRLRVGKSAGHFVQGAEDATIIDQGDATITTQRVVFQGGKYTREWAFSKLIGVMEDAHRPWIAIQVSNRQKTSGIAVGQAALDAVKIRLAVATAIFQGESVQVTQELRQELAELDGGADGERAVPEADAVAAIDPVSGSPEDPATAGSPPVPTSRDQPPKTEADIGAERVDAGPPLSAHPPEPSAETPVKPEGRPPAPPPMWASDPSGRHEFRYWDGAGWTDYVSDHGQQSRDPLDIGWSPKAGEST